MLQTLLKEKNLHFLVPPYNATAQVMITVAIPQEVY